MISQSIINNSDSDEKALPKYETLLEIQRIRQREAEKTEQIEELLHKNQDLLKRNKDLESIVERKKAKIQELKHQNAMFEKKNSNFSLDENTPKFKPQRSNSFDKSKNKDEEKRKPFSKWAEKEQKEPEQSQQPFNQWKERLIMESRIQNSKLRKTDNSNKTETKKEEKSFVSETHTEIIESLESKIQKLESEGNKFRAKAEKFEGFKEENKKLNEKIENLKKKLKETKKNLKDQNSEIEGFEFKIKELTKRNKELEEKLEQSKKYKEKWRDVKKEFSEFKSHFNLKENKKSDKKTSKKKLPFLTYDLIINIDSMKSQKIGWDIWINQDSLQKINSLNNNTIIGLVGGENIGKTFILNKLCGFQLPSGANVHTKGLSMKISDEANNNLIVLDSAGIQTPVYYFDEKQMKRFSINKEDLDKKEDIKRQMINDRTITDTFIQDFILDVCEVILIVVGQLNQNDQKFIERITWKYQIKKRIIVVHNFSNLFSVEDVNQRIEMDIIRAFNTIPRLIPNTDIYEYIERKEESNKESVSHLVLGVDWSESGAKFNECTFEFIKKIIDTRLEKRNLNLIEKLKDFFQKNHAKYLRFKQKPKKNPFLEEDKKGLFIKSNESYEIPNPIFDAFGDLITSPPYEVFERKNKFVSLIEIPDLNKDSLKLGLEKKETDFCCLIVEGMKNWSKFTEKKNVNVSGNRSCGEFKCKIPLGPAYFKYRFSSEKNEERYQYEDGILIVEVNIITEEEEKL